jgi:hypothetical protein
MSGISEFCAKYDEYKSFGEVLRVSGPASTKMEYYAHAHLVVLSAGKDEQKEELEKIRMAVDPVEKTMKQTEINNKRKREVLALKKKITTLQDEAKSLREQIKEAKKHRVASEPPPDEDEETQIVRLDGMDPHESQAPMEDQATLPPT